MEAPVTSVSAYLAMVDTILKEAFPRVVIEGEVSEWRVWNNQRVYFKLKDGKSAMDCVMWSLPRGPIEDGMSVRITGKPNVWAARGSLSFSVSSIEPAGEGAIRRAYELLKAKLEAEGLFALERKRPLPQHPTRIGLVTAADSAAFADFMKMLNARWVGLEIVFVPVQVQGAGSPEQLVAALNTLNQSARPVEVIAMVRGGGSLEDLQAFNAEAVVRAVASSRVPVISGVGHEVDTSLVDLVADLRAATPTDAANRLVPDKREVLAGLDATQRQMDYLVGRSVEEHRRIVVSAEQRLDGYIRLAAQRLDRYSQSIGRYPDTVLRRLASSVERVDRDEATFTRAYAQRLERYRTHLAHQGEKLELLNPRAVLGRGFAIARVEGKAIKTARELRPGQAMVIELAKDRIDSTVTEVHHGSHR